MGTVTSTDGTRIAYERTGSGPVVILVDGALGYRGFSGLRDLAALLASHFTVYAYDRRGRGESSDAAQERGALIPPEEAVAREVADLEALIDAAGEPACLFGLSSGAALVMEAAIRLGSGRVRKIALYEAPYNDDETARQGWEAYTRQLGEALAGGRRGDAVALFMRLTGAPEAAIEGMRGSPMFAQFEAVAPTLYYDHTALLGEEAAVPIARAARVPVPALVLDGGASYPFMHPTALALAAAMDQSQHRTLEGQTHEVAPEALAPVLAEFFR